MSSGAFVRSSIQWVQKGLFERSVNVLSDAFDRSVVSVDGTILQAHAKASGSEKGAHREASDAHMSGLTSKSVALTDAIGKLIRFVILPGQSHDRMAIPMLLDPVNFTTWIGDTACDSDALLDRLAERGAEAVIPPKKNRTLPRTFDRDTDRDRHRIENAFCKIKQFRAIATRYDKTASSFAAGIHRVAGIIAAR